MNRTTITFYIIDGEIDRVEEFSSEERTLTTLLHHQVMQDAVDVIANTPVGGYPDDSQD